MVASIDFAKYVLMKASEKNISLNYTQLQKIVYICDGLLLSYGYNIINENCRVWDYGPVYPKIYKWYSKQGNKRISNNFSADFYSEIESSNADAVIDSVLEKFGGMPAVKLSEWSHQAGSPWYNAKIAGGLYSKIEKSDIRIFFSRYANGKP